MKLSLAPSFFLLALAGCGAPSSKAVSKSVVPKAPPDTWSVTTLDPTDKTPALLWNGLIGIRIGRDGTGNGKPFFAIEEYETTGEEKIRELPNPLALEISFDGNDLAPTLGIDYRQTLDFRTGVLFTGWKQKVSGAFITIECRTKIDHGVPLVSQDWRFFMLRGVQIKLSSSGYAESDLRIEGSSNKSALLRFSYGPQKTDASATFQLEGEWQGSWSFANRAVHWNGRIGGPAPVTLRRSFQLGHGRRHSDNWPPPPDIEIDGPVEDQQAIRSFLYYLRSLISAQGNMSVAPMGLSNSKYNGHVFWDADIWIFPVLALLEPKSAEAIPRYRLERAVQARKSFEDWLAAGRPTGSGQMGIPEIYRPPSGMMFPWESSVSGKETQPSDSKFQHHISGSVAFALGQAAALGLADNESVKKVIQGVASFYRLRITKNTGGTFSLKGTFPPDENTFADNDLYTNLVAQWCLNGGNFSNESTIARLKLPRDEKSFLTYDRDHLISYKQAAAVLAIYPMQFPEAEKQARTLIERFEPKIPPNGPAMSDSIHALIWARLGEKEKAYQEWRESWKEFTGHPLMLFSEKRVPSETYFVTGAAGCLQTVIYGFLGFRIDDKPQTGASWSTPLKNGRVLSIKPNLPSAWKKVTFRDFWILGKRYTLEATHQKTTVTPAR